MLFNNKVVWITGASAGIGRAMALEFAKQGALLALSARRVERLDALAEELAGQGCEALAVPCDVTDEEAVAEAVAQVIQRFGRLDVAIANVGFGVAGPMEKITAEQWRRQLDVNVVGAAMTARHALPELRKTGGRLALVCSVAGFLAAPKSGPYSASKYALRAMGQTLSVETHGTGVSCTLLHPGFVESEIAQVDNEGHFDPSRKDRRPQRLMWTAEDAATVMVKAIHKRKREYVFTTHGRIFAFLGQHFPGVTHFLLTRTSRRSKRS